jgi:hypothetical protein
MSSQTTTPNQSDDDRRQRMIVYAVLAALTVIGFYLRINCLGCLGFRGDEDLTSLAVKSLLEDGVPLLPSGMIYPRFYPYQWILALSVGELGFSEFSIRLPGVLFGTLLIPVSFWVTRRMFDSRIALLVAAGIALSFSEVEMARAARMYVPFFLVYLLAAFTIYRVHFENKEKVFSPWVLLMCAAALSVHQLAYSLAILLLLAIPLRPTRARSISLFTQAGLVGIAFLVTKSIQSHFFNRARRLAREAEPEQAAESSGVINSLLEQISFPDLDLFVTVVRTIPIASLGLVALFVAAAVWIVRTLREESAMLKTLGLAALTLSLAHQFNLVVIALVLMLVFSRDGIAALRSPSWYKTAMACGLLFLLWSMTVVLLSTGPFATAPFAQDGVRQALRTLVDYPNYRLFWSFMLEYPLLAVPLALGTLWGIDRMRGNDIDARALFLVGGLWSALFMNGIIDTKFEFFRYNMHLYVFFLMLAIIGVLELPAILSRLGLRIPGFKPDDKGNRILTIVATIVLIISVNPLAATLTSWRDYRETGPVYRALDLDVYPDFATPGAYVRERLQPNDRIFVIDPREYWNYIGRVDYWIYSDNYQTQTYQSGGKAYDLYVGVPVLHSLADVQSAMADAGDGSIWLLYARARVERTRWLSEPLKALFRSLEDQVVYTGRDENTIVIRLGPDHPIRHQDADIQF